MKERVILFDIDGTLLHTGGAGLGALREGFFDAFPEHRTREGDFPELDLRGGTDSGVARTIFAAFRVENTEENRARYFEAYAPCLERALSENGGNGEPLRGVRTLLEDLRDRSPHHCGLLTGNTSRGAEIKIRHYGLGGFFAFGAYGDEHHDRNRLGPIALRRARDKAGRDISPEEAVIIGDTPRDIACARSLGARVIAVATGVSGRDELARHRPDILLDDLSDTVAVRHHIESAGKSSETESRGGEICA